MGPLLSYSICVGIVLIPLYVVYRTVLSRTTLLSFNRGILLGIYAVAILLPVVMMLLSAVQRPVAAGTGGIELGDMVFEVIGDTATADHVFSWYRTAIWIYAFGVMVLTCRLIVTLAGIVWLVACGERSCVNGRIVVRHGRVGLVPFSWCRWIFIPADDRYADPIVVAHEAAHLARHHWVDLIVAELVLIIDWYNPVAWQMRDSLQDIHEFQADADVLAGGIDPRTYQLFLIKKTVGDRFHALADSLNHSSLKKRITMMLSRKSQNSARLRAMALVPALAIGALVIDLPAIASVTDGLSHTPMADLQTEAVTLSQEQASKVTDKDTKKSGSGEKVYTAVEQMPQFPGGETALYRYLADHIKYPDVKPMPEKTIRVVVQFEVSATGKVQNPRVIRSAPQSAFDKEAVRVVGSLPDFIPGKVDGKPVPVNYTLPITFSTKQSTPAVGTGTDASSKQADPSVKTEEVFTAVEQMPQFPGGENALYAFVAENIKMPEPPADAPERIRAVVRFTVGSSGKVSDPDIIRSTGIAECDAEAIRVVGLIPEFIPGRFDGKPVAVRYVLPITFSWTSSGSEVAK